MTLPRVQRLVESLRDRGRPVLAHAEPDDARWCVACRGRHVSPLAWETRGTAHWRVLLRCGDCGHSWSTVISNETAGRVAREHHHNIDIIRRAVDRLERERLAAEIDAFATALARDLITAADFAG